MGKLNLSLMPRNTKMNGLKNLTDKLRRKRKMNEFCSNLFVVEINIINSIKSFHIPICIKASF